MRAGSTGTGWVTTARTGCDMSRRGSHESAGDTQPRQQRSHRRRMHLPGARQRTRARSATPRPTRRLGAEDHHRARRQDRARSSDLRQTGHYRAALPSDRDERRVAVPPEGPAMNLSEWLARKHADIAAEQPLSLQNTIGALSQRLWAAEQALDQITWLHRPDPFEVWCVHCQWAWPCSTRKLITTIERG